MSDQKTLAEVEHWKMLIESNWLRGVDLSPERDTVLTVASITHESPGKGVDGSLYVIAWQESDWKPYGTETVECLKALESVYGTANPNKWVPGQKLSLYPKMVTAFGKTDWAVRIRENAPVMLTPDQVDELDALIIKTGRDTKRLFRWAGCSDLESFPADKFAAAVKILNHREKEANDAKTV
tara:strand:- start:131 stop:676 length:546 start_codon:yes stop_codon:yes gene_type:complete